jgi:DNA-binding LacI/PurR family transcriptional regulator
MAARRFGVLLNAERCAYSYALADALDQFAEKRGVELSYHPVTWAQSAEEVATSGLEAFLRETEALAGLIMVSSVFSHGLKSLAKFTQRWWPRPASSIGYRLPLVPTVLVDNRGAMQLAANHLITEHQRRQILFIRGRSDSQEANDRYFGFRQALNEHQIISDAGRVLQGDFTRESATLALASLPEELEFDALIAANDEMALGAISELERMGRKVPSSVAVIGFDDIPAASKAASAPLSTLAQPFEALAKNAIDLVLKQCDGQEVPSVNYVPVDFVLRASCGCVPHGERRIGSSVSPESRSGRG